MSITGFGVCRLATVQVFPTPAHGLQVSQLLFGEHYTVLSHSKDQQWLQIEVHGHDLTGWINVRQHHAINSEYFNQINATDFKITTDVTSTMLYKKNQITIVMGSIVPISGSELFKIEEQFAFNGESKSLGQRRDYEYVRSIAMKYLNAPEQPGGRTPFGIDGTGLVHMVFRIAGYALPRQINPKSNFGKKVRDILPGDVAFYKSSDDKSDGVGIVLGDDKIIRCSGHVRIDTIASNGAMSPSTGNVALEVTGIRRVLS